jgi:hypothetical protein
VSLVKVSILGISTALFLSACASGTFKTRQEQRDKLAASSGLYCDFVNGDQYPDLDVELNMRMAKKCDANKSFSVLPYKNSSDKSGVVYCCAMQGREEANNYHRTMTPARQVQRPQTPAPQQQVVPVTTPTPTPAPIVTQQQAPVKQVANPPANNPEAPANNNSSDDVIGD